MEFFQQTWQQIQELFRKMTLSQRVTVGALSVLVVFSLLGLVFWTGVETFIPLLPTDATPEIVQEVMQHLDKSNIPYKVSENRILVSREQRDTIHFQLLGEGLLPEGPDLFAWIFEQDFTTTTEKRSLQYHQSVQRKLERMITSLKPVKSASVLMTWVKTTPFLRDAPGAEATVRLQMHQGKELTKENIIAIAQAVAAADVHLEPSEVKIIDTEGHYYRAPEEDSPVSLTADQLDMKQRYERYLEEKARDLLVAWGDVIASASVELNFNEKTQEDEDIFAERGAETEIHDRSLVEKNTQPGAAPGVASELPLVPGPRMELTSERTDKENTVRMIYPTRKTTEKFAPGNLLLASLSVGVSYDDLVHTAGESTPPTDPEAIATAMQQNSLQLSQALAKGTGIAQANIEVFPVPTAEPTAIPELTPWQEFLVFLRESRDQILLVMVVLVALYFIYRTVRTTVPTDILNEIARLRAELASEESLAPEAVVSQATEFRSTQLRKRVREMVEKNPRSAANLLHRWIQV